MVPTSFLQKELLGSKGEFLVKTKYDKWVQKAQDTNPAVLHLTNLSHVWIEGQSALWWQLLPAEQCQAAGPFTHLPSLILKLLVLDLCFPVFPISYKKTHSIGRSLSLLVPLVLLILGFFSLFSCFSVQTDKGDPSHQRFEKADWHTKGLVYIITTGNPPQTHSIWNSLRIIQWINMNYFPANQGNV